MRVISPLDLRRSLGAILDAASAGERFLVERDRRPLAMLVSVEDGRRLEPDRDEARRRRLAALDRLEALAGRSARLAAPIHAPAAPSPMLALEPAVPTAPATPAALPAAPAPTSPPRLARAGPATPAPAAAPAPVPAAAPPPATPPAPLTGPATPSSAGSATPVDRHQAERRRHADEGLVGLG